MLENPIKTVERTIIALDGHDGTGKTALASALADELGGAHIRPFAGQVGSKLIEAASSGDYQLALNVGYQAIEDALRANANEIVVCNKHWMSVLSLLPQSLWKEWQHFPPTTLCSVGLETIRRQLSQEKDQTFNARYHKQRLDVYMKIAMEFGCHIIKTDQFTLRESVNELCMRYVDS